jgi:hypothetical protein
MSGYFRVVHLSVVRSDYVRLSQVSSGFFRLVQVRSVISCKVSFVFHVSSGYVSLGIVMSG